MTIHEHQGYVRFKWSKQMVPPRRVTIYRFGITRNKRPICQAKYFPKMPHVFRISKVNLCRHQWQRMGAAVRHLRGPYSLKPTGCRMEQEKGVLQMKGRWPYLANVNEVYVGILICSFRIHFHQFSGWLHKTGAWALFGPGLQDMFFPMRLFSNKEKANSRRVGKDFLRYILSLRSFGWFSIVSYH